jgi:putative transposase
MPDHVHLLLAGTADESDLPALLRHWKQSTGYAYSQRHRCRLWQGNYWDRVLRESDEVFQITRYLITDPIRSGLVQALTQYPWWGSDVWTRELLLNSLADAERPGWWVEP